MFGRSKQTQFEITEHPDVIIALNAMWEAAYQAGRRDASAIAKDELAEMTSRPWEGEGDRALYLEGMQRVVDALES